MKKQTGFTLIELVVVIVILGILAATALPKFIDMSGDADLAATQGVAGAIASASQVNYGKMKLGTGGVSVTGTACTPTVLSNFVQGVSFTGTTYTAANGTYGVTSTSACSSGLATCQIYGKTTGSATAYVQCTS